MRRRTLLTRLIVAAALLPLASVVVPAQASRAAVANAAAVVTPPEATSPTVQVYATGGGIVSEGAALSLSVVVTGSPSASVAGGTVSVAVTTRAIPTAGALATFESNPATLATRTLGASVTPGVAAGSTATVATINVPAAAVDLPASAPGVFGLTATLTTSDGVTTTGTGTLVVPGAHPASVAVAAVMALTVAPGASGLIDAQDLATDTGAGGVLTKELDVAERNPDLTLGIDPMILTSIRVLGDAAPASAVSWLLALSHLPNATFPLQYADADPGLQVQAGLQKPLAPLDFSYAMSASTQVTPPTIGEPSSAAPTPSTATSTATPTASPSPTKGTQLRSLSELTSWTYSLGGIAWPAPASVRADDLAAFGRAGMPTTIVSASNTNASTLSATPDAALPTSGGTALVTDDGVSTALVAAATATGTAAAGVANAQLTAQLALAAANSQKGAVIVASLGRLTPGNAAVAATAVAATLNSTFSTPATLRDALSAPATPGLKLVDKTNAPARITGVGELLDLAGESRSGASVPASNLASFSTALTTPILLTGQTRAQLLDLFSVGWSESNGWASAVNRQIAAMNATLSALQISAPESIRQASHQALIPITVVNKLPYSVDVVLRATPSSARLDVTSDTSKTIPAGSSSKILVPVKAQLSNGQVWLALQLYSTAGVAIGDASGASVIVHADWEGIGAVIFVVVVVGFFAFGLVRTVQRRRRERPDGRRSDRGSGGGPAAEAPDSAGDAHGGHASGH